jgi:hypothetical protein
MTRIPRIAREALWSAATWRRFWEANHESTRIDTNKGRSRQPRMTRIPRIWGAHAARVLVLAASPKQSSSPRSTRRYLESGTQESRKGISEIEDKAARVAASEGGSRTSFKRRAPFLSSSVPDSKILSLGRWVNKRQMVLVRTDFTDPSQDASATDDQIISWTHHSPFSGFSYFS